MLLPFFSFMSFLIAIPTGVKFFNWVGTMWRGHLSFQTPMLFAIGFLVTFLFGGLTGVIMASPPLDFHVHDSYFVVAHFHYVVFGTVVFAMFAGFYFWWPEDDRQDAEREGWARCTSGRCSSASTPPSSSSTAGRARACPRRYADYSAYDGFTDLNMVSSIGAFLLGASTLPFLYNVWTDPQTAPQRHGGRPVGVRQLARVGDVLPAAEAQLHLAAPHPVRAPGVRPQAPAHPGP
ncbi:hypothetical protein GCM10018952_33860 [Streptosporangium vulgare]